MQCSYVLSELPVVMDELWYTEQKLDDFASRAGVHTVLAIITNALRLPVATIIRHTNIGVHV